MKELKAGDIRQDGDEQRVSERGRVGGFHQNTGWMKSGCRETPAKMLGPGPWVQADHVGHPILASDLMHLEFRRP